MAKESYFVDENGFYGEFGGAYVPEILYKCVEDLREAYLPIIESEEFKKEYGIDIVSEMPMGKFDAAIVAVAHKQFRENDVNWDELMTDNHVIFDVKCILPRDIVDGRL